MIYFDVGAARDVIDGLRLLEGRLLGTNRSLSAGARELRRVAERSLARSGDQPVDATDESAQTDLMAELLDTEGAARFLNVSTSTVRRLRTVGDLTAVTIGRAVRFRIDDLNTFASTRTENP